MIAKKQEWCLELGGTPTNPTSMAVCHYRTAAELAAFLEGFHRVPHASYLLLVGLRDGLRLPPALPAHVRVIQTTDGELNPSEVIGNYVPDAQRAFQLAAWGLRREEGLIVLLPADWKGPKPEGLLASCQATAPWPLRGGRVKPVGQGRLWSTWWQRRKANPRLLPAARGQDKLEAFQGMVCD